jgi:transmembrane sensor
MVAAGGWIWTRAHERGAVAREVRNQVPSREYATRRGERVAIQLADGTRVMLEPESRLRVPARMSSARTVTLQGAAYFEVTHDPARPFTVMSRDAEVRAIGTAFSMSQYPGDTAVQVIVVQGKVVLQGMGVGMQGASPVLTRGDAADYSILSRQVRVQHGIDLAAEISWTAGELTFRRLPLRDVARKLERWYDVTIVISDETLAERRVTGSFGREGVTSVVAQLADAVGGRYRVEGRRIVIGRES